MPAILQAGRIVSLIIDEPAGVSDRRPPLVTTLSLVVRLSDPAALGGAPVEPVRVRLDPGNRIPITNLSGDPCFLDLPVGAYTLVIGGEYYFPTSQPVTLPLSNPRQPVQGVVLQPLPSYPFPAGTTLIRGIVQDTAGVAVSGAEVTVLKTALRTQTTARGEFAVSWPPLLPSQVITERREGVVKRFVKNDQGGKPFSLQVAHPTYKTRRIKISEIEEGTSSSQGIIAVKIKLNP